MRSSRARRRSSISSSRTGRAASGWASRSTTRTWRRRACTSRRSLPANASSWSRRARPASGACRRTRWSRSVRRRRSASPNGAGRCGWPAARSCCRPSSPSARCRSWRTRRIRAGRLARCRTADRVPSTWGSASTGRGTARVTCTGPPPPGRERSWSASSRRSARGAWRSSSTRSPTSVTSGRRWMPAARWPHRSPASRSPTDTASERSPCAPGAPWTCGTTSTRVRSAAAWPRSCPTGCRSPRRWIGRRRRSGTSTWSSSSSRRGGRTATRRSRGRSSRSRRRARRSSRSRSRSAPRMRSGSRRCGPTRSRRSSRRWHRAGADVYPWRDGVPLDDALARDPVVAP